MTRSALDGIDLLFIDGNNLLHRVAGSADPTAQRTLIPRLRDALPSSITTILMLVAGGITYSAGIIFHLWDRLKFQNVLWHVFVVAGSILHLWAIFDCMVLSRL